MDVVNKTTVAVETMAPVMTIINRSLTIRPQTYTMQTHTMQTHIYIVIPMFTLPLTDLLSVSTMMELFIALIIRTVDALMIMRKH
jgi:hypothetical protein